MPNSENALVQAMLDPGFYDHPVERVQLIETHISWVFLTGEYAYKVKKPVDFGFLDFTRLEQRKFYCEEELRLNSRLAEDIYLSVKPITKADETYRLDGKGETVEYAVHMKEFDQDCLLEHLLEHKQLALHHMDELADRLSTFHQTITVAPDDSTFGRNDEVIRPVEQNFSILEPILDDANDREKLEHIKASTMDIFASITGVLKKRKQQGFIRECHGDMHLGNIALVNNRILIFDGIEFNDHLKWIDTMSELAFLVMDLQDHDQPGFANQVLNRYLQNTGDYEGLEVLRFYLLYRAMVRAKVTGLRLQQQEASSTEYRKDLEELRNYLNLALTYIQSDGGFIAITSGVSGTGKSWLASRLARRTGAVMIRSDRERKRLFHTHENLYTDDVTRKTYQYLLNLTHDIANAGHSVFIDATFINHEKRRLFMKLAQGLGKPFYILHCHANPATLEQRIRARAEQAGNISDADVDVMHGQLDRQDPLDAQELTRTIDVDTEQDVNIEDIVARLGGDDGSAN